MDFPLRYCPYGNETLARLRRLYVDRDPTAVLATVQVPSKALERFAVRSPSGPCAYPDPAERILFWDEYCAERAALHDDGVPSAYLSEMDQGLYGGLLGGEVRFLSDPGSGWISSMVVPILDDWSGFAALAFDRDHAWFRRYTDQLAAFVRGAEGKFGVSGFILINGLNFAFELLGATRTYLSLVEEPEKVSAAMDLAFTINRAVHRTFFETVELVEGGSCVFAMQWLPGRIISESVDPFHMTSVAYFEEWGRGTLEKIFAEFDGGVTHIHANGRHLLEAVATVQGLKAIFLGDDRGFPPSFDVLREIRQQVGNMPLVVQVGYEEFLRAMQASELVGGVLYNVTGAPDVDAANACMDLVRDYAG